MRKKILTILILLYVSISFISSQEVKIETANNNKEKKKAKKGFKICPECGEQVPESWTKHTYKKDGKKCGYDFGGW